MAVRVGFAQGTGRQLCGFVYLGGSGSGVYWGGPQ